MEQVRRTSAEAPGWLQALRVGFVLTCGAMGVAAALQGAWSFAAVVAVGVAIAGWQLVHRRGLTAEGLDEVRWRLGLARWIVLVGGAVMVALYVLSYAVD